MLSNISEECNNVVNIFIFYKIFFVKMEDNKRKIHTELEIEIFALFLDQYKEKITEEETIQRKAKIN